MGEVDILYDSYEWQRSMLAGASAAASFGAELLQNPANPFAVLGGGQLMASALEVFAHASAPRGKPAFGLTSTLVDGHEIGIHEEIVIRKPFGQLKHFVRADRPATPLPKLLIVAPMSGHYATLLRGTVERMLPVADVFVTDWRDAKLVPLDDGRFDLDDYVDYVADYLRVVGCHGDGGRAHMLAVCQPSVPCYAATCLMSADADPFRPKTLTMMGGPIDTRAAPTAVNSLATERPHSWFQNVIATVPASYPGAGRRVYPGFLQLAGFMSMNLGSHLISHWEMFKDLAQGEDDDAEQTKAFYEEYRSVCDMTAEFYLQTVDTVFQTHALPKGELMHRGRRVDPAAIVDVGLLAIEGERDDISGLGQTRAALTIATALADEKKRYYLAEGAGHYGIFNGSKWRNLIAPIVEEWISANG